jgi:purine-binding chemotaxis protein CheW
MSDTESMTPKPLVDRLAQLREEFDSSFAQPWKPADQRTESVLCFTSDAGKFAIPVSALLSITRVGSIVPIPSRAAAFLGLTVVRARLMPVYSVARFTGGAGHASEPHWLALLRGSHPAAIAIESLDGYADRGSIEALAEGAAPQFIKGMVRRSGVLYALLDCAKLYDNITRHDFVKGLDQTS